MCRRRGRRETCHVFAAEGISLQTESVNSADALTIFDFGDRKQVEFTGAQDTLALMFFCLVPYTFQANRLHREVCLGKDHSFTGPGLKRLLKKGEYRVNPAKVRPAAAEAALILRLLRHG